MAKDEMMLMIGGPKKGADDEGGMDVTDEERRSALKAFMEATQNGDVDAGMKAWARMGDCGPPKLEADDEGAEGEQPSGEKKRGMYREE